MLPARNRPHFYFPEEKTELPEVVLTTRKSQKTFATTESYKIHVTEKIVTVVATLLSVLILSSSGSVPDKPQKVTIQKVRAGAPIEGRLAELPK